jgi:monoterpene epsilon-lactone hydrolase
MASLRSMLAPLVLTLRGSKREFSSAERTLARIKRLGEHPAAFEPRRLRGSVTRRDIGGWPVFEVGDARADRRAVYLHGGVYVFEIDPLHWRFIALLAQEAGIRITVPIMPLAPRGVAATVVPAVADLVAALVDEVGASRVSVLGDSSGGGMALATAMLLRDRGVPPLGHTVLIAPWLDISGTDPRLAEIAPTDPWLAVPGTHAAGALYRAELGEFDPLVSPLYGSLEGLGPVTMFSGTRDILNADALRLVALARASALQLDYIEGAGMIHNYPILPMPEGDAARKMIVEVLTD